MKRYLLMILISFAALNLTAQVITRKTIPTRVDESISLSNKPDIDVITMPAIDVNKLLVEDEINKGRDIPFRFGYAFDVSYNMQNSGTWTKIDSGRIWSLKIVAPGAYSINLAFSKFYLPENSMMYIYNDNKTVLQGPYTSENNSKKGNLSTDLVEGSGIILEYFEPEKVKGQVEISISKIVHGYRDLFPKNTKSYGSSGSCNIDINCPEGNAWQDESNAVAMILVGNEGLCSGCMINNTNQDFTPYFLTANHCIEGQDVGDWVFRFQYKSPTCGGGDDYSYYSYYGATLQANAAISDFALLELDTRPTANTGINYAGWSRNDVAPNSAVGIHHPSGDVMKISFEQDNPIPIDDYNAGNGPADCWRVFWENGTTEGGSSGSPLFDPNHRIIGQLYGGTASCTISNGHDNYGRFNISWDNGLAEFLDPNNTEAMTANTVKIPYITGPSTVCASNSTFTIQNRPPDSEISWSHSGNLSIVSGQGTNQLTVKQNENGGGIETIMTSDLTETEYGSSGLINATFSVSSNYTTNKTVWVGNPAFTPIVKGNSIISCSRYLYTEQNNRPVTWSVYGPFRIIGPNYGHKCTVEGTSSGVGWVYATVSNDCGSIRGEKLVEVNCGYYAVSPNPVSSVITISQKENYVQNLDSYSMKPIKSIKVFDKSGILIYQQKFGNDTYSTDINVSSFQTGCYIIKINEDNNEETHTIIKN